MNTHALVMQHTGRYFVNVGAGNTQKSIPALPGDSANILFNSGRAFIQTAWARTQFAGKVQIHSLNMGNDITGVQSITSAGGLSLVWPDPYLQECKNQDTINVDFVDIGDAAGDIEGYGQLTYYTSMGNEANGRYATADDVLNSLVNVITLTFHLSGIVATTPNYYGATSFKNAINPYLIANTDYAILGYNITPAAGKVISVTVKGPDSANYRYGGPGIAMTEPGMLDTRNFFIENARRHRFPGILVMNSANWDQTFLEVWPDENFTGGDITLFLAQVR